MKLRDYYDFCPHGTCNPSGCGVCIEHRKAFDALAEVPRLQARVRELERWIDDNVWNAKGQPDGE